MTDPACPQDFVKSIRDKESAVGKLEAQLDQQRSEILAEKAEGFDFVVKWSESLMQQVYATLQQRDLHSGQLDAIADVVFSGDLTPQQSYNRIRETLQQRWDELQRSRSKKA